MNMKTNLAMAKDFSAASICLCRGAFHFSPICRRTGPPHDKYEPMMREHQIDVAYDGLQITVN
jgi:hypothetical protein